MLQVQAELLYLEFEVIRGRANYRGIIDGHSLLICVNNTVTIEMVFTVCVNKNFSMVYRIWLLFCYVICRYISSFVVILLYLSAVDECRC